MRQPSPHSSGPSRERRARWPCVWGPRGPCGPSLPWLLSLRDIPGPRPGPEELQAASLRSGQLPGIGWLFVSSRAGEVRRELFQQGDPSMFTPWSSAQQQPLHIISFKSLISCLNGGSSRVPFSSHLPQAAPRAGAQGTGSSSRWLSVARHAGSAKPTWMSASQ